MRKVPIDDSEVQAAIAKFTRDVKPAMESKIALAFDQIGQRSQADYWRKVGGKPLISKLTVRGGRLIKSLSPQGGARSGGGASEQIRNIRTSGTHIYGFFGSRVPHAAIHEYGGIINHHNLFGRGIQAIINMPKRPYLEPAAKKEYPDISKNMAERYARVWPK